MGTQFTLKNILYNDLSLAIWQEFFLLFSNRWYLSNPALPKPTGVCFEVKIALFFPLESCVSLLWPCHLSPRVPPPRENVREMGVQTSSSPSTAPSARCNAPLLPCTSAWLDGGDMHWERPALCVTVLCLMASLIHTADNKIWREIEFCSIHSYYL